MTGGTFLCGGGSDCFYFEITSPAAGNFNIKIGSSNDFKTENVTTF